MFRWLTSVKTAMCLILIIVISSIAATVLPEDLNIYQTFWYRGLLLLFCLNLIFCTVQKLPMVIKILKDKPELNWTPDNRQLVKLNNSGTFEKTILDFFRKDGYQVSLNNSQEFSFIAAQKNKANLLAPYLLHLSLVIVFLGAFISSFGVNENISCNVGEAVTLPENLIKGISIKVEDFKTLYDQSGNVDNWQSTFRLEKQGKWLEPQTVKVNQPFEYEGVKFYQSGYGSGHEVKITGQGAGTYSVPNNKVISLANQVIRIIQDGSSYTMQMFDQTGQTQSVPLNPGKTIDLPNNQKLTYQGFRQYTVLNVKHDPGTGVVLVGMTLMALCSPLFWLGRYQNVRLRIDHANRTMSVTVACKNKELKEKVNQSILERVRG